MAEASIQVRPEIVEMPVPVTRENTVVVGGITGVFPEGTLEITENGNYDVVTKERVNVYIPQDPETFFNPEINSDIDGTGGNSRTTLDWIAGFIKEIPVLRVGEEVTKLAPSANPFADVMNGKRLKLTGGSNAITTVYIGQGDSTYSHGPSLVDLSELTVSPTASFGSVCNNNNIVEEAYLPRQDVEASNLSYSFYKCTRLRKVDLGGVVPSSTASNTFQNASSLEQLIIRNTARVFNAGTFTFTGSAVKAGTCQIYVPDSLVDAYKADSVWSAYAAQIHPLSELPEE